MQKLSDRKIEIIPGSGQNGSGPVAPKKGVSFFGLFTSTRVETCGKSTTTVLKEPVLKSPPQNVPRADLTAVKGWVALEEKIVHNYKEQKAAQSKSAVSLPKIPAKQPLPGVSNLNKLEKKVLSPSVPKKGFAFFGLFTSWRAETRGKIPANVSKESVLKSPSLNVPRADLTAVKGWVALEEKIVHNYKEQKAAQSKSAVPLPVIPSFETFSTQRVAPSSLRALKLGDPLRDSAKTISSPWKFLPLMGWLAAGVFVVLYVQGTFPDGEASQRFAQLQSEKEQLGRSYAALKNVSERQSAKVEWLNSELQGVALELKMAKADKVAYEQGLEKKYREELMRITGRYESELTALRGTVQTQNSIVNALKAQGQAFDKIIDQAGLSALPGAAAGLPQGPLSNGVTSALQGVVTSINGRQGSVVINLGAAQGASSGRWITISRSGIGLAVGRIDRVYPTMSVAVLRNEGMLQVIQQGDSVSFS